MSGSHIRARLTCAVVLIRSSWRPRPSRASCLDRQQHLLLARRLLWPLDGLRSLLLADGCTQRIHEVDDVVGCRTRSRRDGMAVALLIDEIDQSGFVVILEFLGRELRGL